MAVGATLKQEQPLRERLFLFRLSGVIFLLGGWQILSMTLHPIIMASPASTCLALWQMIETAQFQLHFLVTVQRVFVGIGLGAAVGFLLGTAAGLRRELQYLLEPLRWVALSLSPVVIVVLGMIWFGMGSTMVIFITAVMIAPIIYVNTVSGMEMVDEELLEMARFYHFNLRQVLQDVYFPAIFGSVAAALVMVVCMGVRVVLLAEILGASSGIGFALGNARANLETPQLFAWVLVSLLIVGGIEFLVLNPLKRYVLRWKK